MAFDINNLPEEFIENPYPTYAALVSDTPVLKQPDGSYVVSSYRALESIYKDTSTYSSDKTVLFKSKFGDSPLYEHHTTSLVFNDPPLHTRVRKIMTGALTPKAISGLQPSMNLLVDGLLDSLENKLEKEGQVDLISEFASLIPVNVIGNMFNMPLDERGPLREWSLAILGALEPVLSKQQFDAGNTAVVEFKAYLKNLADERRSHPGDPDTDVLTRLIDNDIGELSETELLHQCIFILNAGHETTTNLIGNSLALLHDHPEIRDKLIDNTDLIKTGIDEFLRYESPNQFGNRLTMKDVTLEGVDIPAGCNLHLCMAAANRDPEVYQNANELDLSRKPNKHMAFAGGPHSCIGLNLAKMEGRTAIAGFVERFSDYAILQRQRSPRVRFRGFSSLMMSL